ncbi:MAG: hypothetical protein MZU97_00355 [Bacillus subtilis]|nr:hypothetical protein [Bacillus subtilis]
MRGDVADVLRARSAFQRLLRALRRPADGQSLERKSEISTIDTVLFLNGADHRDRLFATIRNRRVCSIVIFDRIDWNYFVFDYKGNPTFRMAYNPVKGGDYRGVPAILGSTTGT